MTDPALLNYPIAQIVVPENRKRDLGDVSRLAESIALLGLLNPISITPDGTLIAGRHRLEACRSLGWAEIPAVVSKLDELHRELAEIDENLIRNELTVLERSEHLQRRMEIYEALHPETRGGVAGGKAGGRGRPKEIANETISPAVQSFTEDAAEKLRVSQRTVQQEVQIAKSLTADEREAIRETSIADSKTDLLDLARVKDPELRAAAIDKVKSGEAASVKDALRGQRRAERIANIAAISAANTELKTAALYPVLYADPPWEYEHAKASNRSLENHYPTMPLDEICALPVADCSTPDAILFLWATSPKLEEALRVVNAWGFTYRTNMVWVKDKIGMGYYARQKHELLLICTRGEPPTPLETARPPSVIEAPRGKHSEKPAIFAELIEKMYPELPKLELFARAPREGWEVFGNQVKEAS